MTEMDVLQSKIIHQIETYLSEENLKNDFRLSIYERQCHGWIPLSQMNQLNKLSTYKYETILNALRSKRSNIIEINLNEPICVRRRRSPVVRSSTKSKNDEFHRTVVVNGLPRDAKFDDLNIFFNRFSPIDRIEMISTSEKARSFNGKVRLIFRTNIDAEEFVRRSQSRSIIYVNDYVLQLCNGYTLVCQMLADCDDRNEKDFLDESTRVSFKTHLIDSINPNRSQSTIAMKPCLKSNSCATEQILFCQNTFDRKSSKFIEYQRENLVKNSFAFEFYHPEHLLHQTHECVIIAALNPHCFTIQLKQDAIEFDKFQREINEFYNEVNDSKYFVRAEDIRLDLCVVSLDENSSKTGRVWNRSQILEYDPYDQTVNLFYVDLGTWDEYVPIQRLRFLLDCFHRHLVFSLNCRLANLSSITDQIDQTLWPNDATQQFLAVLEQTSPQIEFLSIDADRCFQTNLFVVSSGHFVCVNDYLIHIRKAQAMPQQTSMIDENHQKSSSIHPVVSLYMKLGETLKRSNDYQPTKVLIKLISLPRSSDDLRPKDSKRLPVIFVYLHQKIVIPDWNIYILLQTIHTNIDRQIIDDYAMVIRYQSIDLTRASHNDLFNKFNSIFNLRSIEILRFYSIDFVYSLLEHYRCRNAHIYYALDKAKHVQMYPNDLNQWFRTDNELDESRLQPKSISSSSSIDKRLPFSNRSIGSITNKNI